MDALLQLKESLAERYDIKREIGAGGMATVYLAHDLRHDRPVALKLLNPELGAVLGSERFLSEIRVTANLQHPNLLPLFDSGAADGLLYYVMPFVEGESLRSRLDREKQLPVDEAVRMTVAIANALDYAHSHGVIHRDLKPENILLQAHQPVIADFGIALAVSNAGGNRITQTGLSLGTPQYMSPEQATGDRVIDGRSDIYSLGAVAYEMLTGEPPHTGNTSQAIIARMLTEKPRPMRVARPTIPEHVEFAVQHALEKLPADRFSSAHQFAEALHGHGGVGTTGVHQFTLPDRAVRTSWKSRLRDPVTMGLSAVAVASIAVATIAFARKPAADNRVVRFAITTPDTLRPTGNYPWPGAISPDGSVIVYSVRTPGGPQLYSLRTNEIESRPIPGSVGGFQPLFSPDGQWVGFQSVDGKFRRVKLDGGQPSAITDANGANGADWTTRDEIVIGSEGKRHGLLKVSAAGGELTEFAKPDSSKGEGDYLWPIAFPDGKHVVFAIWNGSLEAGELATVDIDGNEVHRLGLKGIRPLAVVDGILVYIQADGAVMGVKINGSGSRLQSRPVPVHDPVTVVAANNGNSGAFISSGGALLHSRGGTIGRLSWIAPSGAVTPISRDVRPFVGPELSPDEQRIAVTVDERDRSDIWVYDIPTGTLARLSSVKAAVSPSWTTDGNRVVYLGFGDNQRFAIWSQAADGGTPPSMLAETPRLTGRVRIAPDGKSLLYQTFHNGFWNLFRVQLDPAKKPEPYLVNSFNYLAMDFSPDGKWVALATEESGRFEIFIRSYPDPASRLQISASGGTLPAWSRDGTRIYYKAGQSILSAKLALSPALRVISRDTVMADATSINSDGNNYTFDVSKDGRILGPVSSKEDFQLIAVPNWLPELKQRMGQSR